MPPSKNWFNEYDKLNAILSGKANTQNALPVKVAILDTGLSDKSQYANALGGYKDFVEGSESKKDETGHGTDAVRLMYKMCRSTNIFVGRVWRNPDTEQDITKVASRLEEVSAR